MPDPSDHTCPRCGYDLSGARAAARGAGTAEGLCSECGLRFQWADVESGRLLPPRFSYEHGPVLSVRRFFGTLGRAAFGWPLWKRLRMEHPVRPERLMLFVCITILLAHMLSSVLALLALRFVTLAGWSPSVQFGYGFGGPARYQGRGAEFLQTVAFKSAYGYLVTWGDAFMLACWPYGTQPWVTLPGGLYIFFALHWEWPCVCLLAQVGPAMLLLGLRQTRRQFLVRPAHVLRGACMSAPFVIAAYVVLQAIILGMFIIARAGGRFWWAEFFLAKPLTASFLLMQTLWWWSFCRAYLRAPHALGIAVAGTILGALLCMLLAILVEARMLYQLLA